MKFSELTKCPFCKHDEFYTNDYYKGTSNFFQKFDGTEANDNSQMYDGLTHIQGARAYCGNCWSYLGNTRTDKLGKRAEKALYLIDNPCKYCFNANIDFVNDCEYGCDTPCQKAKALLGESEDTE